MSWETRATIAGEVFVFSTADDGLGGEAHRCPLAAGVAGTMSRTSDTAGTLTLPTGHGITTASIIGIFWSGGRAYHATVGTVNAAPNDTSVPFTLASGDAIPSGSATAIVASKRVQVQDASFDTSRMELFALTCDQRSAAQFWDADENSLGVCDVEAAAEGVGYTGSGTAPLSAGTTSVVDCYNGSTAACTLRFGVKMPT